MPARAEIAPGREYGYGSFAGVKDTCKIALMAVRGNGLTFVATAEKSNQSSV
jgi:hypothetical protein